MDMQVDVIVSMVSVTPQMARAWLLKNDKNRPVRDVVVHRYAKDMAAGNWQKNGETIKLSKGGCLLDGQHRLLALIRADVTVDMLVVSGLSDEAFHTIDTGMKRSMAQILALLNYENSAAVASAARWIITIEDKTRQERMGISETNILKTVERHPLLSKYCVRHGREGSGIQLLRSACFAVMVLAAEKYGERKIDDFLDRFASGENIRKGDPEYQLRERLIQNRSANARLPTDALVAITIKAVRAFAAGRTIGLLRFNSKEEFPEI